MTRKKRHRGSIFFSQVDRIQDSFPKYPSQEIRGSVSLLEKSMGWAGPMTTSVPASPSRKAFHYLTLGLISQPRRQESQSHCLSQLWSPPRHHYCSVVVSTAQKGTVVFDEQEEELTRVEASQGKDPMSLIHCPTSSGPSGISTSGFS